MYRAVAGKKDRKRIHTFIHQWTSHRADVLEYRIKDSLKKIDELGNIQSAFKNLELTAERNIKMCLKHDLK